jgi:hypothetical protein
MEIPQRKFLSADNLEFECWISARAKSITQAEALEQLVVEDWDFWKKAKKDAWK